MFNPEIQNIDGQLPKSVSLHCAVLLPDADVRNVVRVEQLHTFHR